MKEWRLISTVLCALLVFTARAGEEAQVALRVVSVNGNARYIKTSGPNWAVLHTGDELNPGSVVQTSVEGSTVEVALGGAGDILEVSSNSVLKLISLEEKESGPIKLKVMGIGVAAGQLRINLASGSEYEFQLNSARLPTRLSAGHHGDAQQTLFTVDGAGTVTVLKGTIKATVGSNAEKTLHAGEQLRGNTDESSKAPP